MSAAADAARTTAYLMRGLHELRQMFDRFYRADAARGRKGGHAGLGLAIVKAIAVMHGGQVQVRCEGGLVRIGWVLPA